MRAARIAPLPARIIPDPRGALAFYPVANDRLGICPECGASPADARVSRCRQSGCPFFHAEVCAR